MVFLRSVQCPIPTDVLVSDLDNGMEYSSSKLAGDTKLGGGMVNVLGKQNCSSEGSGQAEGMG